MNLGGQVHALQVLEAANPYIKVLSDPVEYLGALWMPFRRDHSLIEQAIQQCGPINAMFAHLDVVSSLYIGNCKLSQIHTLGQVWSN